MTPFAHPAASAGLLEIGDALPERALEAYVRADRATLIASVARGLGHDLRNALQLVALAAPPRSARDAAEAKLERAIGVLDRMAEHARDSAPACVRDLLSDLDTWQRCQTALPEATLAIDCAERLPAIAGRTDDLLHALLALVTNAKQAVAGPATVRMTATAIESGVQFTIDDFGPGITAGECERAFEPFVTTRAALGHAGLGLTAARTLIERSGGSITLSAATGGGLRAIVRLPRWRKR